MTAEIINWNLTEYMGPDHTGIMDYANAVVDALNTGKLTGPLTAVCPECGSHFEDMDEVHEDDGHIIVVMANDAPAVVVGCEGYYMIDPNPVGIDSPGWTAVRDQLDGW